MIPRSSDAGRPERGARSEGFGPDDVRFLELHEARAHAGPGRRVVDLGDAILLHDPTDGDPFVNRLSALRLPAEARAFDRRLTELLALFFGLGRVPHVWLPPAYPAPPDLARRLNGDGFVDLGGAYRMARRASSGSHLPVLSPARRRAGVALERLSAAGSDRARLLDGAARVMTEAFGTGADARPVLAAELDRDRTARTDVCVLRVDGEPVAAGRRFTADGATYLSSIATRPPSAGRGYGSLVTAALVRDGRRAGGSLIHLSVDARNARARRMYERLGFRVVGDLAVHLLLC
jgi:ribosomal protein S18 acetylase RimI-like enzyme